MGEFERKLDQLQKMAVRLQLPSWQVTVGEKEWRPVQSFRQLLEGRMTRDLVQVQGSFVQINGSAPVISGWMFIAKIEHDVGGNMVKRMTDGDSLPLGWHSCGPTCDHCKVERNRNNTFMLANVQTGEFKQVGSSCMGDFLGESQRDPERIAAMFDYLISLEAKFDFDPDKNVAGGSFDLGVPPVDLMRAVLKIVQEDSGYISAEKGEQLHCLSTGDRLRSAFWGHKPIAVLPDAAHVEQAIQVVEWLRNQREKGGDSLWLRNISILADRVCITQKNAGLFASGYVAWNRELQRQLRQETGTGEWIGEVGEKIVVSATLERQGGYESAYGFVSVLSFRDEEGNALVWKTSARPNGLVTGESYHLSATVKGQGEFKGNKQTDVIRVKCAELELFAFGALPGFKKTAGLASPDRVNESGQTPLFKAVFNDSIDYAKILLANGADPNGLSQFDTPILGYATSVAMANLLIESGSRAFDLSDTELDAMVDDVRELILSTAMTGQVAHEKIVIESVVSEGAYSGRVLNIESGVVTQKVDRNGATVVHALASLSQNVVKGEVLDIRYVNGVGVVSGKETQMVDL
jgi:hypothetical protein